MATSDESARLEYVAAHAGVSPYRTALEELREMTRPMPPFNPVRVAIRKALAETTDLPATASPVEARAHDELEAEVERLRAAISAAVGVLAHGDTGDTAFAILTEAWEA